MINENYQSKKYYYKAYGMVISTEFFMSELVEISEDEFDNIDVDIVKGYIPKSIHKATLIKDGFQIGINEAIFSIDGVGSFYITNGNRIVVELCRDYDLEYTKIFILGSALGILFLQRYIIAIHSGAIAWNNHAILITGNTGAGKSTLTTALRNKGFDLLADDVAVIRKNNDKEYMVYPSFPQQKLCGDAMDRLGLNKESFKRVDPFRDKYAIPIHESFASNPVKLGFIFELVVAEEKDIKVMEVSGSDKMLLFMKNIYRIEFTKYMGISRDYFKECTEVVKNIKAYRIIRPKEGFFTDRLVRTIGNIVEGKTIFDNEVLSCKTYEKVRG